MPLTKLPGLNFQTSSTSNTFTTSSSTAVPVASGFTCTITIGANALISTTVTSPVTIYNNMVIHFTTSGTLPTGITANTEYYVQNVSGSSGAVTFNISATPSGSNITTSGTQSGTQTANLHTLSQPITTTFGGSVAMLLMSDGTANSSTYGESTGSEGMGCTMYLFRNGTQIAQMDHVSVLGGGVNTGNQMDLPPSAYSFIDTGIDGTSGLYVYEVKVASTPTGGTTSVTHVQLMVYEMN